ncbi:MAG: phosphoenolpyruvate--protein phosphotransferase [Desulfobacteraceae bacterium]|nr:phosphoenolpyruvate--protein phosphotransferase [Desulfobacteraceae bacterium]MCF8094223.1 phosphoenolpyruvate--protein phosphotransferase [Desulfobacteraceae bacterium]
MTKDQTEEIVLYGISGSQGICIGKAYMVDREGVDVVERYYIGPENVKKEINRFKQAVNHARKELSGIIEDIPEDLRQHAYILETHFLLHKDKMLYGKTLELIENEQINAEWALRKASATAKSVFQNISDPYLQARAADIEHVTDRILRHLLGAEDVNISEITKRVVLVANNLSPAETSQIQLDRVMGFITDRGGKTSHTSIIARTLEIPAVLGLERATALIKNEDLIIVDGNEGIVIVNPAEETLQRYKELSQRYEAHKKEVIRRGDLPATSSDGESFRIMGNIELPEEVVAVKDHGGDGIGLFRTEFLYLSRDDFPEEQELFDQYREVVELMAPLPVTIRTLDINGDKEVSSMPTPEEANPALGLRAIRFCLKKPEIFKTQLRAIMRAAAHGYVRLLLPMISGADEVTETIRLLDEAAAELEEKEVEHRRDIEIGIMIEIPSAAVMADMLADLVDFFSIGTNDLVQYTLAIDRGNRHVAHLYNPLHPAVIRLIRHVVDAGRYRGKKTYMCGEMAADPINLPILLGLGIEELSMAPQSIPEIKNLIRRVKVSDVRKLMDTILQQPSEEDMQKVINDSFGDLLYEDIYSE